MERVALDLVGPLPKTDEGNQWILVVGDYATRWMEAYALPDARAETVAAKFVGEFVCRYGVPREVHSDQGTNFESEVFKEMCRLLGIRKSRTTAYNPKSDGLIERFNKTLVTMVAMMIQPHKSQRDWDCYLPFATSAYRCTVQESLRETPNMMMLGREVTLPIDLTIERTDPNENEAQTDYASDLRARIQGAHDRAQRCLGRAMRRQKKNYDRRASHPGIKENDFVWLFNPAKKRGVSPKLQLKWEGPYLVLKKLSDVVFRIQRSKGARPRVVHADRLKPCHSSTIDPWRTLSRAPSRESGLETCAEHVQVDTSEEEELLDGMGGGSSPPESLVIKEEKGRMGREKPPEEADKRETCVPVEFGQVQIEEDVQGTRHYPKRKHKLPLRYR